MVCISQTVERTLDIAAPLESVRRLLFNPVAQKPYIADLERLDELGANRYRFVFRSIQVGSFCFAPAYAAQYETTRDECRWTSIGNEAMRSQGHITVHGGANGRAHVCYREELECVLELGRTLGTIVPPIARTMLREGVLGYLKRVQAALEGDHRGYPHATTGTGSAR